MCPPAFDASADMVFNGTDGQAIMYLSRLRRNYPLPDHVIDLNPYQFMPRDLPGAGKMWYLVRSTEKNRTEFGFWRQKEAACEIFTDSDISGWKTTLEFIETKDARENLTDWVMKEYKITEKGPIVDKIQKESREICNVFRSDTADDDYLELDDLADPLSSSTSSNNSSRSSLTLDDREYFDSEALLGELESDNNQSLESGNNQSLQAKSNSSFSVTASAKPFEVLMQPATSGSLVCASERQPPAGCTLPSLNHKTKDTDERVPDHTVKPGEQAKKSDPSCPAGAASSSNSGTLVGTGKRKAAADKIKGLKKYFCFMPK